MTAATLVPAQPRASAAVGERLPEYWFEDDEWHLEAAPLLSAEDLRAYSRVKTAPERETFIADFWRRHDPTPATPANEFRREFERRIRFATQRYEDRDSAATFGYQTDRGRWYVSIGPPDDTRVFALNRGTDEETRVEGWRYKALDEFGGDVTVNFDLTSIFSCSWRGGRYRIESPAPRKRFEGVSSRGGTRRPFALTYPGGFVYLSFPIDPQATKISWILRGRKGEPFEYVQGDLGGTSEPILQHLAGQRFFEPEGFACTERMPPDEYTLAIWMTLVNGGTRTDSVAFDVK